MPTTLANWYSAVMAKYPEGHRYSVDNMFTSAPADELLPGIRKIIQTLPPHPSHFVFAGWKPSADRTEMVYGVEDEIYLGLYTAWHDAADDARYGDWAPGNMAAMSHLATGISLADENLAFVLHRSQEACRGCVPRPKIVYPDRAIDDDHLMSLK